MAQQFEQPQVEQPQDSGELRTQRMTAAESRAVIALWQQEQVELTGLTDKPAVPDVAEGLDITVEDVQRLLQEVRAKRLEEERAFDAEQALVTAELRLAEEDANLAEIRRQRAEIKRLELAAARQSAQWQPQQVLPRLRRGKPRQAAPVEWTGDEDFWQGSEEDEEARQVYRAVKAKRNSVYVLYTVLLTLSTSFLLMLFLYVAGIMLKQ